MYQILSAYTVSVCRFLHLIVELPKSSVLLVSDIREVFIATAARFERAVFAPPSPARVWSPVFVQEVFPITVNCASVTYLLLLESAISAVVASAPAVTNPFAS